MVLDTKSFGFEEEAELLTTQICCDLGENEGVFELENPSDLTKNLKFRRNS
jgi:hypothetical protein